MAAPTDYFADISKTDMMRVVVALATEVFETRDRLSALEQALSGQGVDLAVLDAPVEPAAYDDVRLKRRDAFVARVFEGLKQPGANRSGIEERAEG